MGIFSFARDIGDKIFNRNKKESPSFHPSGYAISTC